LNLLLSANSSPSPRNIKTKRKTSSCPSLASLNLSPLLHCRTFTLASSHLPRSWVMFWLLDPMVFFLGCPVCGMLTICASVKQRLLLL
jgi:hypothetical protein